MSLNNPEPIEEDFSGTLPEEALGNGGGRRICGVPWEAWELLDPERREALLAGRIRPDELLELVGWLDDDDDGGPA